MGLLREFQRRKESMLLNIANIEHNPEEVDRLEIDKINYDWRVV